MSTSTPPSARVARILAVVASTALAVAAVCAWGWYRAARDRVPLESLGPEDRQALVQEMLAASPGAFAPALFEPAIGYTLRPGEEIEAWGDTFTSNELGYRTGPPGKPKRTFRVVFIGDSWTFGLGVSEAESFPSQLEALARQAGAAGPGGRRQVEVRNLGLPGYNTMNELAALDFFFDRLRPDAVVICPTANDADSASNILPNGSLTRAGVERDGYGADHSMVFRTRLADSYLFRTRWRAAFAGIRGLEERLRRRGVPLLVYFAASWDEPFAHALVADAGLDAPYVVTPPGFAGPRWRNPPPWRHGTPEANRIYARMVYNGLAELLGWPAQPKEEGAEVPVYRRGTAGDGSARAEELLREETRRIPESYVPGPDAEIQCVGAMDWTTGLTGKATTVLVRRRAGARRAAVTLRRLPDAPSLYPLAVRVSIPSAAGGTEAESTLPADGPGITDLQRVVLDIPGDLPEGAALDITIRAARAAAAPGVLAPRSMYIAGIEQE
ncbi:MAG TPA: GDSL-type esterase/lipase family protein [Thermoanaerobaculia bacterium]|nr:GDSL-type esterase/lipase family protein [Thermoanaerobaculia bacterium]